MNKNNNNLALSFPKYREEKNETLGNIVRIFAQSEKKLIDTIDDIEKTWHLLHLKVSKVKEFNINNKTVFYEFLKFQVPGKNNKNPSLKIEYIEKNAK